MSGRRMRVAAIAVLAAVVLVPAALRPADAQQGEAEVPVNARIIENFRVGSSDTVFGALEFIGGLELTSPSGDLGGMSAIRFGEDGLRFVGVMDTGKWFSGRIERDDDGRLAGMADVSVTAMRDASGAEERRKWLVDAEGMAIRGDELIVSFERSHRVDVYDRAAFPHGAAIATLPMLIPENELRNNRGLETVAVAPADGPLEGAAVIVAERSLNAAGDNFAAVLDGPREGIFFVRRDPPYDVTDGAFLPDGDLLLLERRFNIARGIGMRIRRIAGATIAPGATVDGEVLIEADFGYQIDNMEGLDVISHANGEISLIVVSDDNHSILQRNLFLEFRLVE
jgi:hypothetical protein